MAKILAYIVLCTLLTGIYFYRYQTTRPVFKENDRVRITSTVSEDPSIEGYQQKITLEGIKIYLDRFPEYSYGEKISVEGEVVRGKAGYYLKDVKVLQVQQVVQVLQVRERVLEIYSQNLPEPHNGLLSGIVLGTKKSLDPELVEGLRNTGTIHVVVASGTNIAIFASGILFLLVNILKAHRKLVLIFSLIFIWGYIFFIGFQPPIVRAGIMASIVFVAAVLGREGDSLRALMLAAVIMLLIKPAWLFDLGFQLSFLATLGIILLGKRIAGRLGWLVPIRADGPFGPISNGIRETLSMTLAAQIAVLPLIIYKFGSFPLISPIVNVLVVPIVPIIMAGGFILGIFGFIQPLAQIFSWFIFIPLEYFVKIIELFS